MKTVTGSPRELGKRLVELFHDRIIFNVENLLKDNKELSRTREYAGYLTRREKILERKYPFLLEEMAAVADCANISLRKILGCSMVIDENKLQCEHKRLMLRILRVREEQLQEETATSIRAGSKMEPLSESREHIGRSIPRVPGVEFWVSLRLFFLYKSPENFSRG